MAAETGEVSDKVRFIQRAIGVRRTHCGVVINAAGDIDHGCQRMFRLSSQVQHGSAAYRNPYTQSYGWIDIRALAKSGQCGAQLFSMRIEKSGHVGIGAVSGFIDEASGRAAIAGPYN